MRRHPAEHEAGADKVRDRVLARLGTEKADLRRRLGGAALDRQQTTVAQRLKRRPTEAVPIRHQEHRPYVARKQNKCPLLRRLRYSAGKLPPPLNRLARCHDCGVEISIIRDAENRQVDADFCSDRFAMSNLSLAEGCKLASSPALIASSSEAIQEHIDGRSQDDDASTSKAAKDRLGKALMLVGTNAKNQVPIQQKSLATVKNACNRLG